MNHNMTSYPSPPNKNPNCSETSILSAEEQIALLNDLILKILLDPKDRKTHNIIPFIKIQLRKFKLESDCDELDVLIEAYTRAVEQIREGYVINNPVTWLKGTSLNIIRTVSKKLGRQKDLQLKLIGSFKTLMEVASLVTECDVDSTIDIILKAFDSLSAEEQEILTLRVIKGLAWSNIARKMSPEIIGSEHEKCEVARLRQKGNRALKKLREKYHQARP